MTELTTYATQKALTYNIDITIPASPLAMTLTSILNPVSFVAFYVASSLQ